jgi:Transketolase
MPFRVIHGSYHVLGYSPDGDSIRFQAANEGTQGHPEVGPTEGVEVEKAGASTRGTPVPCQRLRIAVGRDHIDYCQQP